MREIVPAIIAANFKEVESKIAQVEGLTNWVQLDIMDGLFVPAYSFQDSDALNEIGGKIKIEAHLMVESPEHVIREWMEVVDRIIFHVESTDASAEIINMFEASPVKLGLALKLQTPVEAAKPFLDKVSLIQLMSIKEIGEHGHKFEEEVLNKIKALRAMWPDGTISIDGGITLEAARLCFEAGADQVAVGSAIWGSGNIPSTIREFQSL